MVGAGVGGLASAIRLAAAGWAVTVCERADQPGGKMRTLAVNGGAVDSGPTVFTMRWAFEALFSAADADLAERVPLKQAEVLARHAWTAGGRLDLFADADRSEAAIAELSGADEARRFRRFCAEAKRIYDLLEGPF
ncbi:MAG: FAD-dependent oxidoreductase, partial [Pseudomonadota bacterium]